MTFGGICITTPDAPRLAAFYRALFQAEPLAQGSHYSFGSVSIWDPGDDAEAPRSNPVWLQCLDPDIDALYQRLLRDIPDIHIIAPPERKPWGAYSFWAADPDGNRIAVAQAESGPAREDLDEAEGALLSTLRKCEKIQSGGRLPPSQSTLLDRRVWALRLALGLINERNAALGGSFGPDCP